MVEWILLIYEIGTHQPLNHAPYHHYATEAFCQADAEAIRAGEWATTAYTICKPTNPPQRKP